MYLKTNLILLFILLSQFSFAQTPISGSVSGTWSLSGSPYIITAHCKVPVGQKLIISPGVKVIIGENLIFTIEGIIEATGTIDNPIIICAPNDTVFWDRIHVNYSSSGVSKFHFCEISNAKYGLYLQNAQFTNEAMKTEVYNCKISNCTAGAIFAEAKGLFYIPHMAPPTPYHPYTNPKIQNCIFRSNKNGIIILIHGSYYYYIGAPPGKTYADASPIIVNNIFVDISGIVLKVIACELPGNNSFPIFMNNDIVNSDTAIYAQLPYDILVKNNIFMKNSVCLKRTGEKTANVYYNCLYNNSTNFIGFPDSYGKIVMQNRNNTPCDVGLNIFVNPLFSDSDFNLSRDSPCIDAGTTDSTIDYLPSLDIYGNLRINDGNNDGNAIVDIGACEYLNHSSLTNNENYLVPKFNKLHQNYPNPFNPSTTFEFSIPYSTHVVLKIYDVLGKEVATLIDEELPMGQHKVNWNVHNLASGVYIYKIQAGEFVQTRKMILMR